MSRFPKMILTKNLLGDPDGQMKNGENGIAEIAEKILMMSFRQAKIYLGMNLNKKLLKFFHQRSWAGSC